METTVEDRWSLPVMWRRLARGRAVFASTKLAAGRRGSYFRAIVNGGVAHPTEESIQVDWWTRKDVSAGMAEVFAVRALDALVAGVPFIRGRTMDSGLMIDTHAADGTP